MSTPTAHLARHALMLAEADPRRAVDLAVAAAQAARVERDIAGGSVAARAKGLALFHLHDVDAALMSLREAVAMGRRARSRLLAAEARMTLAYVLNWRGK